MSIASTIQGAVGGLIKPLTKLYENRQQRIRDKESAESKLVHNKQEGAQQLQLTDAEAEALRWGGEGKSWKDEYVTVSIVSIFNLILIGGIATAFGYPAVLTGVGLAIGALVEAGVNVGFLLEAVTLAAIGLKIWRKT